uniref:Uncharacterized protein n=1 Tax=Arundo donax TaxID=35708 RepID=A0A0A8ZFC4_ARUDO
MLVYHQYLFRSIT